MFTMKKLLAALLLFVIITGGGLPVSAKEEVRATWLWNPWMFVEDEAGTLTFLESKNVNKVYLQIDREVPREAYRSFISGASDIGISIYALDGAPDWVGPNGRVYQENMLSWMESYQQNASAAEQFGGVHLDVEPYLYSGWVKNQKKTITAFQDLLQEAKERSASMNLPLEVDLPFWFDEISYSNKYGKGVLAEWVITRVDGVTLMAYRDSSEAIIEIVKEEIAFAEKHGKAVVIGVETMASGEGNHVTFYEEGEAFMQKELSSVKHHYGSSPGFGGFAVHHVGSWKTMKQ